MTAPIPRDIPDLPALPGMPRFLPSPVPATAVVAPVRHPVAAAYRVLVALVGAGAVTVELLLSSTVRTLSYFSVQSTILLTLVFLLSARRAWTARRPSPPPSRARPSSTSRSQPWCTTCCWRTRRAPSS